MSEALILMYHRVARLGADPFDLAVTPEHFEEHLAVLAKYAQPMPLSGLSEALRTSTLPRRAVALTFDDGYLDNLESAKPALERSGIPATVYIATGQIGQNREFWWDELERVFLEPGTLPSTPLDLNIGGRVGKWDLKTAAVYSLDDYRRYSDWKAGQEPPTVRHEAFSSVWQALHPLEHDERRAALNQMVAWAGLSGESRPDYRTVSVPQLKDLASGNLIELAAHTVNHPALSQLSLKQQREEIQQSRLRLEEILGKPVSSFAYPHGVFSEATVDIVADLGFDSACASTAEPLMPWAQALELPRFQVGDWGAEEFSEHLIRWMQSGDETSAPRRLPPERTQRRGRWRLRLAQGSEARLVILSDAAESVRVAIERAPSGTNYDIQLNLPGLKVVANHSYALTLRARADRPRSLSIGVSLGIAPWTGLGLYEQIEVSAQWTSFECKFRAQADGEDARIHFDLADSDIPVEVSGVNLSALPENLT